ncbi:BRISC and BRCA1-A complex member 2 [Diachasma alloeum]|uniref:BRISC and BRCA1-A complex member 2 n=1 Tax=Diachasma alloeum TaxID=454923 RepID=UPI0007382131|nr:BRISC and BRCA1-A complex member 2 [Diachasma alloeum]
MATMDDWDSIGTARKSVSPKMISRAPGIGEGVDEYLEPLLNRVLMAKPFGINLAAIELRQVAASCGDGKGDRFRISIPYANQKLDWVVMFNSICPDEGPDFEFSDKSFLADPASQILEEFIPSLYRWNHLEPDALLRVLTELVFHYKKHQIDQLNQFGDRLNIEYKALLSETEICSEDVELILLPNSTQPEEAHFLIRIAIDFSKLPGKHAVINSDAVLLLVTFQGPHWNRITPHLYFSKDLEETFGGSNALHLPSFPEDKSLMEYVPEVKKSINDKINLLITTFEKKRNFVNAVLCLQSVSVLEYDAVNFDYIVCLLAHQDFHFLLQFHLPPTFPRDAPRITMQSIYHMTSKTDLFKHVMVDFVPYSPRWEPEMMFTKALNHIITKEVDKFKNISMKYRR